jgi:hypothetical protein
MHIDSSSLSSKPARGQPTVGELPAEPDGRHPEDMEFSTEPRQAPTTITRAIATAVPFGSLTADESTGRPNICRPGQRVRTCPM